MLIGSIAAVQILERTTAHARRGSREGHHLKSKGTATYLVMLFSSQRDDTAAAAASHGIAFTLPIGSGAVLIDKEERFQVQVQTASQSSS